MKPEYLEKPKRPRKPKVIGRLFNVSKIVVGSVGDSIETYKYNKVQNSDIETSERCDLMPKKHSAIVQDAVSDILDSVKNTKYKAERYEYLQARAQYKLERKKYKLQARQQKHQSKKSPVNNNHMISSDDETKSTNKEKQNMPDEISDYDEPPSYDDIV